VARSLGTGRTAGFKRRLPSLAVATAAGLSVIAASPGDAPITIVDLQPDRVVVRAEIRRGPDEIGSASLTNLNPHINSWFLLTLDWPASGEHQRLHLENLDSQKLLILSANPDGSLRLEVGGPSNPCQFKLGRGNAPGTFEEARKSGLPYVPLCDGRLYLRNPVVGRATKLEMVTDFLRSHVWGGERFVSLVKKEAYKDKFLEQAAPQSNGRSVAASNEAPAPAVRDAARTPFAIVPPDLGIEIDGQTQSMVEGEWYAVRDLADVFVSVMAPGTIAPTILHDRNPNVSDLGSVESAALVYLVAFELERFDLRYELGTEHPRLGWSPRPPASAQDPRIAGPDGIDTAAPLARTGMVSPALALRTVATFAGGFKRDHGAFRYGPFAERNHGSHYGFVEEGVTFSTLQPGLATVWTTPTGGVQLQTWTSPDGALVSGIRDARQNGVPLIEYDASQQKSSLGAWVNRWGEGNWSGSANEDLRTVRAGLCLQEAHGHRFLIYGYFSDATPSAMARVFQAYGCRYAMQLDMNALEHTYLALYVVRGEQRVVEHLIEGMAVLDQQSHGELAPRFLSFPDDRDFFYLTRGASP
jgi:hypothetical protein